MAAVKHCQQNSVAELIDFAKLAKQAECYLPARGTDARLDILPV